MERIELWILQAVTGPIGLEAYACFQIADVVSCFAEKQASTLGLSCAEVLPVATLLFQAVVAESSQQHVIRPRFFGMQFKAIALEVLGEERTLGRSLIGCSSDGIPKDWEPTILLPILTKAPLNTVGNAGHVETEPGALRLRGLEAQ